MPRGFFARHPRKLAALAAALIFAGAGAVWFEQSGLTVADVIAKLRDLAEWCAGLNPAAYVAAVAILPYCGVPSSFIYPLGGNAYGVGMGIFWTTVGLVFNLPIGYFIGTRLLRGPIERWMQRRGRKLPEVPPGEMTKLVVLGRILPGPPLIAQNFLLALAGVPFPTYFIFSLPICVLFATGILIAGGGLMKGNVRLLVTGVCAIVALALLAHVANAVYKSRKQKAANTPTPAAEPSREP